MKRARLGMVPAVSVSTTPRRRCGRAVPEDALATSLSLFGLRSGLVCPSASPRLPCSSEGEGQRCSTTTIRPDEQPGTSSTPRVERLLNGNNDSATRRARSAERPRRSTPRRRPEPSESAARRPAPQATTAICALQPSPPGSDAAPPASPDAATDGPSERRGERRVRRSDAPIDSPSDAPPSDAPGVDAPFDASSDSAG